MGDTPRPRSEDLTPGTHLVYADGTEEVVLDRRKTPEEPRPHGLPFHPGWWLTGRPGGLADFVIDHPRSPWQVLPAGSTPTPAVPPVAYDRAALVEVLVYHQRRDIESCYCGWGELGRSHSEHVADVYEEKVRSGL